MPTLTDYGPKKIIEVAGADSYSTDMKKNEISETKFLGYLRSLDLKDAILGVNLTVEDNESNEEAYTELVQFRDDKSLSLIREPADNGRKAHNKFRWTLRRKRKTES